MPADRLIHPRAGHSRKVSGLTDFEFRVWVHYILAADDFGVLRCSPVVFQASSDALAAKKPKQIAMALEQIVKCDLLQSFDHQGQAYLYQYDWQVWQKVSYPRGTDNPSPPVVVIERCEQTTQELFRLHPGGKGRKFQRRSEVLPENSEDALEKSQPTRAGTPADRLMANGKRLMANGSEGGPGETPFDEWLGELQALYPQNRVTSGYHTETAFIEQFQKDTRKAVVVWGEMVDNLENQKQGHEWRVKGMVPRLDKWLSDGKWRQRHEAAPASVLVTDRTAGTLAAAAEILKGRAS